MNNTYTHEFEILNGTCHVETDEFGKGLIVKFEGKIIVDSCGDAFTWDFTGHLKGAALKANQNKQLRKAGERELYKFLARPFED